MPQSVLIYACTVHIRTTYTQGLCRHILAILVHSPASSPPLSILSLPLFLPPIVQPLIYFSLSLFLSPIISQLPYSFPPITQPSLHLSLPHSHDLPTDQVYLYDGTQSCRAANFVPFLVLATLIIFCFVFVAPFLLCLLTKKRWTVSSLHVHCSIF